MVAGLSDDDYIALVAEADARVADVAGVGFVTTPLVTLDLAAAGIDRPVMAKVETGSVGGSHKARHLFGLLLDQLIIERTSTATPGPLAIASCGNAAVGAAIVARSAERELAVFVPPTAEPAVLDALAHHGARVTTCERTPSSPPGDPCIVAMEAAVADGHRPFTVQGTVAPAVIDGGRTLGLELAAQLAERSLAPGRLFVQIGGGALATAVMDGLARSPWGFAPRLHPVQPESAHPYVACWHRAWNRLADALDLDDPGTDAERAALLTALRTGPLATDPDDPSVTLPAILAAEPDLMQPWPTEPHSVAGGILDDVTYDWRTVMAHQLRTGGWPITVTEETFVEATKAAADQVDPPPDATGAAGLAGLLTLERAGDRGSVPDERADGEVDVVLLTGVAR
ncbi:MAG: PLP-dependent lyase/thiolase [Actinomycetota bacterium]